MIKQNLVNDNILEKKFKILRTSILLGNMNNREETIQRYKETAREIDDNKRKLYEDELVNKVYTTDNIDEEKERLKDLISFIEKRIQERNEFIDDYIKVTSNFLDDLPKPSMENDLDDLKNRYENICRYIDNVKEIEDINEKLKNVRKELEDCYKEKANDEINDSKMEDEIIEEFNRFISKSEYYSSLNYTDIDFEINNVIVSLNEKKDVMNTFISSYEALKNAGISGAEREEYLSYVGDAKKDYYNSLERKYVLDIYRSVLDKKDNYDELYQKRLYLDNLFDSRNKDRYNLEIYDIDELRNFIDICNMQLDIIKEQRINIDTIDNLIEEVDDLENRLNTLEEDNNSEEILNILDEYKVEKVKIDKIELPNEEEIHDEVYASNEDILPKKEPNMVVKITEPIKLNVKTASDTAKLVMKKVVIVLEPKKYGDKKDKLKEAELELEERKRKEKEKKEQEKELFEFDQTPFDDDNLDKEKDDSLFELNDDAIFNLDTKEVKDNSVKESKEINEIKLNIPEKELTVPTEIFIEEPKEEVVDLFKETDPFLDDNMYEIKDNNKKEEVISNMPKVFKIGSVKPNSMLSQIEEVQKENNDIILPTMGLTKDVKEEVPIVSENYIN